MSRVHLAPSLLLALALAAPPAAATPALASPQSSLAPKAATASLATAASPAPDSSPAPTAPSAAPTVPVTTPSAAGPRAPSATVPVAAVPAEGPRASARVLVVPRHEGDPLPPATDASLRESVRDGLRRGGAGLVEAAALGVTGDCGDDTCVTRLRGLGVRYLVRPTLAVVDRDYTLHLELVDLQRGVSVGTFDERCSLCGLAEARSRVAAGAARLVADLAIELTSAASPTLIVTTDPPGALVSLDRSALGPTPLERSAPAGPHTLEVTLPEYAAVERRISLAEGEKTSLHLTLAPAPTNPPERRRGRILLGLGVPLAVVGLALAALDEAPIPLGCGGPGDCKYRLDVTWPAVLGVAAGAALTTAGAVLLQQARRRARRPR